MTKLVFLDFPGTVKFREKIHDFPGCAGNLQKTAKENGQLNEKLDETNIPCTLLSLHLEERRVERPGRKVSPGAQMQSQRQLTKSIRLFLPICCIRQT